jgi:hypothetical protein
VIVFSADGQSPDSTIEAEVDFGELSMPYASHVSNLTFSTYGNDSLLTVQKVTVL